MIWAIDWVVARKNFSLPWRWHSFLSSSRPLMKKMQFYEVFTCLRIFLTPDSFFSAIFTPRNDVFKKILRFWKFSIFSHRYPHRWKKFKKIFLVAHAWNRLKTIFWSLLSINQPVLSEFSAVITFFPLLTIVLFWTFFSPRRLQWDVFEKKLPEVSCFSPLKKFLSNDSFLKIFIVGRSETTKQ